MKSLSELTLADLMGLYNNYILVEKAGLKIGVHYSVIWKTENIDKLESEIKSRIKNIEFKT